MATKYIYRRTCGFSGNNAYKGRILYSDRDTYKGVQCYSFLGTADLGYSGEGWLPQNKESSVLAAVGGSGVIAPKSSAPSSKGSIAATESVKQATANSSGGWFGNVIGDIGGSIEFGRKKAWLPFAIVFSIVVVLVGGFMFKTK